MAPEQISTDGSFGDVSARTDVYALGCTAFELLTGRVPFEAETLQEMFRAHLFRRAPLASAVRPGMSAFDRVLARALEKHADDRYATPDDFARDLGDVLGQVVEPEPELVVVAPAEEESGPRSGRPLEVLIVDDDPVFRRLATRCVQVAWYRHRIHVRSVDSGAAAVAAAREKMPALIVLDYRMPGMSGIETLTRIRDLPDGTATRVIVVSASVGSAERWRFGVLGVSDFVGKPVEMTTLVSLLGDLARQAGWDAVPAAGAESQG
jgi:serine/threonine-protein kinase